MRRIWNAEVAKRLSNLSKCRYSSPESVEMHHVDSLLLHILIRQCASALSQSTICLLFESAPQSNSNLVVDAEHSCCRC